MLIRVCIGAFFWIVMSLDVIAQEKYEHEKRIKAMRVPETAHSVVEQLSEGKKVKWFEEVSQKGISLEAKFKLEGFKYSVEFSTKGELEDLEIQIDLFEQEAEIQNKIIAGLDSLFESFKIQKTQIQYRGKVEEVLKVEPGNPPPDGVVTAYELVVVGSRDGVSNVHEIHFSGDGTFQNLSRITLNPSDNLVY